MSMLLSHELSYTVDPQKLKGSTLQSIGRDGTSIKHLKELSLSNGYLLKVFQHENVLTFQDENLKNQPVMVHWNGNHFVILEKVKKDKVIIVDPSTGRRQLSHREFYDHYSGVLAYLERYEEVQRPAKKDLKVELLINKVGKYLFQEKRLLVTIIFLSLIFQMLNAVTPFLTEYLIDSFMARDQGEISYQSIALLVVVISVLFLFISLVRMFFIVKLQVSINRGLTNKFINKIFSLPLKFYESNSSGDIASRIHNISAVREIISRLASTLILDISLLIVFCGVMLYYSPVLSTIVFLGAFIQVIATMYLLPKIDVYTKQEVQGQAQFQSKLIEVLRSATFIKTVGSNHDVENQMGSLFENQLTNFSKRMNVSSVLGSISSSVNLSLPLVILIVGVWISATNNLTIGAIVAFSTIAGRFMTPLGSIIGSIQSVKVVEEMIDRVEIVLSEEEEDFRSDSKKVFVPNSDVISFQGVSFGYFNNSDILNSINLKIHPNEKVFLIGKTGSGKSTLLKLLAGLYSPSSGDIYLGKNNLKDVNLRSLRKDIGFIVQDVQLFNDTILNNIKYFSDDVSKEDIIQAAKDAEIHKDIMNLKMGYQTIIGENGMSLSGGQRQRIAIARVFVKKPKILIIDEGTSNLDMATEKKILTNINRMDVTVVAITHRVDSIRHHDTIYELEDGTLTLIDSAENYAELGSGS